ncbi:MAG: hypothetical protein M3Z37_00350 [Candidatus Eremiobacteraeota bacterium]|nr:hypothetical protein [Candidatus Eremiobacteraeota bacterium]
MRIFAKLITAALLVAIASVGLVGASDNLPIVLKTAVREKVPAPTFRLAFAAQNFSHPAENSYFPLRPGTTFTYVGIKGGATATDIFRVTGDHKTILGVSTTVVRDTLYAAGKVVEETTDWYAPDNSGNIWYFGEATRAFHGKWTAAGSWQAGIAGARPGVYAKAKPKVGDSYMQEFFAGRAGDSAEVLALHEPVSVPYGSFKDAQLAMEWSTDEPGAFDAKYYVLGVGVVQEFAVTGDKEKLSLAKVEAR